jgi:hypothetical protein
MNLSKYANTQQFLRKVYDNNSYIPTTLHKEVIKDLKDILDKYITEQLKMMTE